MTMDAKIVNEVIADCIRKRARAKQLEDEASVLKEEANTLLMLYRDDGSITDVTVGLEGVGKITFVTRKTTNTNMELFKMELVNAGVNVTVIHRAEEAATSTKESTSPQFTPERVKNKSA